MNASGLQGLPKILSLLLPSPALVDKGNAKLLVVADAEGLQTLITLVYIGIAAAREIATMDVGSCQRVTDADAGIEIGI